MIRRWSLFPLISAPMPLQMALDEILFRRMESAGETSLFKNPILRFYFSSEPWITVGYSDPVSQDSQGKICRRMTGGGRVEHGKDVLFSLVARKSDDESFKSVRVSYLKIHEAVKAAFEASGKNPRFYRCDEKLPRGGDCFLFPIATDLGLGGEKIAGGAQKRSSGVLLHQESVKIGKAAPFTFVETLKNAFAGRFGINYEDALLEPGLLKEAKKLAREKYETNSRLGTQTPDTAFAHAH